MHPVQCKRDKVRVALMVIRKGIMQAFLTTFIKLLHSVFHPWSWRALLNFLPLFTPSSLPLQKPFIQYQHSRHTTSGNRPQETTCNSGRALECDNIINPKVSGKTIQKSILFWDSGAPHDHKIKCLIYTLD